ncbi:hypothetical protein GLW04_00565 [Halobacillus litoralis]|uniref:Uncharacterized protein n=1 Tax=Halobacillus litoralis TaxID=45668 RepID=A0A845DM79_9BACI|nr:hypothetical protein [Halobacillus litoralis]MYL18358.1 hypothetical protein [Halobacillus litoralis]
MNTFILNGGIHCSINKVRTGKIQIRAVFIEKIRHPALILHHPFTPRTGAFGFSPSVT